LAQAKAELQTLQAAMESYYSNTSPHTYPTAGTIASPCSSYFANATPAIVPGTCPTDPFSSSAAEYEAIVSGNYYVIASVGTGANLTGLSLSGSTVTKGTGNICVTNGSGC
jgi:hypothetical protein